MGSKPNWVDDGIRGQTSPGAKKHLFLTSARDAGSIIQIRIIGRGGLQDEEQGMPPQLASSRLPIRIPLPCVLLTSCMNGLLSCNWLPKTASALDLAGSGRVLVSCWQPVSIARLAVTGIPEQANKAELLASLKAHNENDPSNSYHSSVNKVGQDSLRSWCRLRTESGVIRWQENVLPMQPLRPLTLGLFCGSLGPVLGSVPSALHLSEAWGLPPTILLTNSLFCTSPSGLCIQVALSEPVAWAAQVGAKLFLSCWESFSGEFLSCSAEDRLAFSPMSAYRESLAFCAV